MDDEFFKAGPELDALIAERVFGWKWHIRGGVCYAEHDCFNAPDLWPIFSPSNNIAAAWEVVEKIATLKPHYDLSDGHCMIFYDEPSGECAGSATGETAPLAICRAALKAVGK